MADHSTSSTRSRACATVFRMISTTSSWVLRIWWARWIGEVDTKVWIRARWACRTASPARAMSAGIARARPAMVARLVRRAISETASKSPIEAIGKPASMMSTPIVSSSSATASFSSKVMVAPGHCSPSRSVVSKITIRSRAVVLVVVVMALPCRGPPGSTWRGAAWCPGGRIRECRKSPEGPGARPDGPQGRVSRSGRASPTRRARDRGAVVAARAVSGAEPALAKARLSCRRPARDVLTARRGP